MHNTKDSRYFLCLFDLETPFKQGSVTSV